MNELTMNLASKRVYDGYLKFLIVAEAAVTNVLRKLFAMDDCFGVSFELKADTISHWNAVFHVKEKGLHRYFTRCGIRLPSRISRVTAFPCL
jgi:hypothetical protein